MENIAVATLQKCIEESREDVDNIRRRIERNAAQGADLQTDLQRQVTKLRQYTEAYYQVTGKGHVYGEPNR